MANLSPVHHLDRHAHSSRGGDGCLGILAWWIEERQNPYELPRAVTIGPRHAPSERKPRAANSSTALSTAGLTCPALVDNSRMTWARPGDLECLALLCLDCGFGALVDGIEGFRNGRCRSPARRRRSSSRQSTARSMVSLFSARDASAPARITASAETPLALKWGTASACFGSVCRSCPRKMTSTPASSSNSLSRL